MEALRISPLGQGQYKNAGLNETFQDEEVWPVNVNKLVKNMPVGDTNSEEEYQNLSWANKPNPRFANKVKKDGGSRRNKKNNTRKNRNKRNRSRRNRRH